MCECVLPQKWPKKLSIDGHDSGGKQKRAHRRQKIIAQLFHSIFAIFITFPWWETSFFSDSYITMAEKFHFFNFFVTFQWINIIHKENNVTCQKRRITFSCKKLCENCTNFLESKSKVLCMSRGWKLRYILAVRRIIAFWVPSFYGLTVPWLLISFVRALKFKPLRKSSKLLLL